MSCKIKRIIQLKEAINYQTVKVINDDNIDITKECQYQWSHDGVCWTSWAPISTYNKICKNLDSDYYLRILISDTLNKIFLNNIITDCYHISLDNSCIFLKDFCQDSSLFQPYNNLDCALMLQQQMADSVVCMFGIPIYYIKCEPRENTKDYTFKEYLMHDVVDIKQMKLMIPDGQMPSSNPKLTEFDFEWQTDWETEISKTHFANAFGDKAIPMTRDMIYIPMMKRMWEINAAYDEKNEGLMWRSTTWKLSLIKYNDATNVGAEGFDEIFDNWTSNMYEKVFGEREREEQSRMTGADVLSAPSFAATNLYDVFMEDAVRKQYTKDYMNILDKQFCHKNIVFARNIYKPKTYSLVNYQKGICGPDGTIIFLMETPGSASEGDNRILKFGEVEVYIKYIDEKFEIKCGNLSSKVDPFKTYMIVIKWNKKNYVSEMHIYNHTHRNDIPSYKLKPEMYYIDFDNPTSVINDYELDWETKTEKSCEITPYPVNMTNIKLYNKYLDFEECTKECVKYVTNNENCIINDQARPINSGHGYNVR